MTAERARAYGRVVKTLADMGPSKLHRREEALIREAADALLFAESGTEVLFAAHEVRALASVLVDADRWLPETAERLVRDVEDCGPGVAVPVLALAA